MKNSGLSVIIRTERQFNHLKEFLGEEILYLTFQPQMLTTETGVIIYSENENFSIGSVGSSKYQESQGFRLVEFSDYFKEV